MDNPLPVSDTVCPQLFREGHRRFELYVTGHEFNGHEGNGYTTRHIFLPHHSPIIDGPSTIDITACRSI